tara:strand:- start:127 stop:411 length:285 start_codon:yes stop_codon:yes gene_type:complete
LRVTGEPIAGVDLVDILTQIAICCDSVERELKLRTPQYGVLRTEFFVAIDFAGFVIDYYESSSVCFFDTIDTASEIHGSSRWEFAFKGWEITIR